MEFTACVFFIACFFQQVDEKGNKGVYWNEISRATTTSSIIVATRSFPNLFPTMGTNTNTHASISAKEKAEEGEEDNVIVIVTGISGPSSSGKTTLSRALRDVFSSAGLPTVVLHEDDFYLPEER